MNLSEIKPMDNLQELLKADTTQVLRENYSRNDLVLDVDQFKHLMDSSVLSRRLKDAIEMELPLDNIDELCQIVINAKQAGRRVIVKPITQGDPAVVSQFGRGLQVAQLSELKPSTLTEVEGKLVETAKLTGYLWKLVLYSKD